MGERAPSDFVVIRVCARRDGSTPVLDVRDCGRHASEALAHLFDPFYSTQRRQSRIGLGAKTVYKLMPTKLGETVAMEIGVGKGVAYWMRVSECAVRHLCAARMSADGRGHCNAFDPGGVFSTAILEVINLSPSAPELTMRKRQQEVPTQKQTQR